jgi:prepilin-type processing-associated H-X9-DG protein
LVVIGIIAILISVLLPVVNRAQDQARALKCMTNLRQLAIQWQSYANENKGLAVPGRLPRFDGFDSPYWIGNGMQYRPHWYEVLGAQMKIYADRNPSPIQNNDWKVDNDLYMCPAVDWRNSRNFVWGYNYQFLGNTHQSPPTTGPFINYPVKVNKIRASDTVMAADSMGTAAGRAASMRSGHYDDGTADAFAMGNKGHLLDPPHLVGGSDFAEPPNYGELFRSGPDPRHRGMVNVAFCDGRVERMSLKDMGYQVRGDGSMTINGDNKLFSGTGEDILPPAR